MTANPPMVVQDIVPLRVPSASGTDLSTQAPERPGFTAPAQDACASYANMQTRKVVAVQSTVQNSQV
jgi:hypothetical protein